MYVFGMFGLFLNYGYVSILFMFLLFDLRKKFRGFIRIKFWRKSFRGKFRKFKFLKF